MTSGLRIEAAAGGFPGQVIGEDAEVMAVRNLPNWIGKKLGSGITGVLHCPAYLTNDTPLCGLGEAYFGAGITKGLMAYYTVSTGVNGVRIADGVLDSPPRRYELGFQVISHDEEGNQISLETLIGGGDLEKRLGIPPHEIHDPEVWSGLEKYLAAGLYNTILFWGPELIVLGGKMMRDLDIQRIEKQLHKMPKVFEAWPKLKLAALGDESGIKGAHAWLGQLERH